jgi:hypothetical protein
VKDNGFISPFRQAITLLNSIRVHEIIESEVTGTEKTEFIGLARDFEFTIALQ